MLVVANGRVPKITNFGLWDFKNFFIENTMAEDVVFLNPHQAPEVLIGHERPSLCSDVWSLGAVILQWMLERPPWDLQHLCDMYQYRHDRQASALHDAMDNQVRSWDLEIFLNVYWLRQEIKESSFGEKLSKALNLDHINEILYIYCTFRRSPLCPCTSRITHFSF